MGSKRCPRSLRGSRGETGPKSPHAAAQCGTLACPQGLVAVLARAVSRKGARVHVFVHVMCA